jgi:HK97 family phage major capsid protein
MPAKNLQLLKRQRSDLVIAMRTKTDEVETRADKKFTDAENVQYQAQEAELTNRTTEIEREERLQQAEASAVAEQRKKTPGAGEFRDFAEFFAEVRDNPQSDRLQKRDVTMGNGTSTGLLVPETFDKTIRQVTPQTAIFRPRSVVIPAGDAPDAAYNMISLDQSGEKGFYSGVSVKWTGETGTRVDGGGPTLKNIKLEPEEISAYIDISDKMLRNSAAAGELIQNLLRGATTAAEEDAFQSGDGVSKPLGIIGHSSTKTVTRGTANTVKWPDIKNIMGAFLFGGSPVFIVNQTCLPQIMGLEDTSGHAMWMPNAAVGPGGTLCGFPLLIDDMSPALGSEGDLMLVDLQYYYIKDGASLAIFLDPYTQKVNGLTRVYAFWNVDGQPMLTTPIKMRGSSATVSPFVVLK